MALAVELLQQARELMTLDASRPRQASLRRGLSAAYYALFHLLIADALGRFAPESPARLAPRIGRAFAHAEMKQVCKSIADRNDSLILQQLMPGGFSSEIRTIAGTFVLLQDARHSADYDTSVHFERTESISVVSKAETAFTVWQTVRQRDEANVFLAALLFNNRWGK